MKRTAWLLAVLTTVAWADEVEEKPRFEKPQRIEAGGKLLGEGRYYPSPVLHDVDGDGKLDIVVGDLRGMVTVARRKGDAFEVEGPLVAANGKQLKFSNW